MHQARDSQAKDEDNPKSKGKTNLISLSWKAMKQKPHTKLNM